MRLSTYADLDSDPAPRQSDANLRSLVHIPSVAPFWAYIPPLWASTVSSKASKAPEMFDFNADPNSEFFCGFGSGFQSTVLVIHADREPQLWQHYTVYHTPGYNVLGRGFTQPSIYMEGIFSLQDLCFHFSNLIYAVGIWSWTTSCWILRVTSRLRTLACAKRYRTPSFHDYIVKPKGAACFMFFRRALVFGTSTVAHTLVILDRRFLSFRYIFFF